MTVDWDITKDHDMTEDRKYSVSTNYVTNRKLNSEVIVTDIAF